MHCSRDASNSSMAVDIQTQERCNNKILQMRNFASYKVETSHFGSFS